MYAAAVPEQHVNRQGQAIKKIHFPQLELGNCSHGFTVNLCELCHHVPLESELLQMGLSFRLVRIYY